MADVTKTVEIIFGAKNDVSQAIDDITQKFSNFSDFSSKITDPLAGVGDSVLKVDAALAALAIGGLAYAIKESANFNKSFALISTSITATGGDLAKYRDDVLLYSTASVKSLEDINASLYTAAQAGVKYTESIAFMGKAEQLAVANNANLNTTVDLLTGTMNAYGFTIKDVGHLNDVFFQSTLIGKQTIDELGTSMGQVVAIAANSGVSFEELSAAIATLTAKGMKTEEAITAVKGVITTIIAPSKEAAAAAKDLGLNFSLTELSSKGLAVMLQEIMAKTNGSKEATVGLFNEMRAMNGVLQLTGDGGKFFNDALQQIINSSGASETAYKKMVETFSNQSQMLINVARGLFIDVGTKLEPMAAEIAGGLSGIFAGIKVGVDSGAFDPLFTFLDGVGKDIAAWMVGVGNAMPEALSKIDFTILIKAFQELGAAFGEYFGELDLTKADDLATALQLLIDIGAGLVRVTTGMVEAFRPFASVIADFLINMAHSDTQTQETIGKMLAFSQAIRDAGLYVVGAILAFDAMGVSMKGLFEIIGGGAQVMWNGFTILFEGIKGAMVIVGGMFIEFLDSLTFGLIPGLDTARTKLAEWGKSIDFTQDAEDAKAGLFKMMQGFVDLGNETGTSTTKLESLKAGLTSLPTETKTKVTTENLTESHAAVRGYTDAVTAVPANASTTWEFLADGSIIEKTKNMIYQYFPDGEVLITNVGTQADTARLAATKAKIDEIIPAAKVMEIQSKLDEVKLREQSDIVQKSMEWTAKVDIAQIEASAKVIVATFSSIDNTITSTGNTISSMVGAYVQAFRTGGSSYIEDQIRKENERRDAALKLQTDMTTTQIALIQQQTKSLAAGNAMIQIDGKGLQPQLEAFMFEILKAIQVKANAEGMQFLVGL